MSAGLRGAAGVRPVLKEPLEPWPALILAQAIFEEQLQVLVVRILHAVVEPLVVVGVGAASSSSRANSTQCLMRRLPQRPLGPMDVVLAQAEHSRQRGKTGSPPPTGSPRSGRRRLRSVAALLLTSSALRLRCRVVSTPRKAAVPNRTARLSHARRRPSSGSRQPPRRRRLPRRCRCWPLRGAASRRGAAAPSSRREG